MSANIEQRWRPHAPAPFNKPSADIRSSDGTDFRVHSVIIAQASAVFAGIFANPQAIRGANGVDVNADYVAGEDAKTLDSFLRLCYPVKDPAVDDPQQLRKVIAAAITYAMEKAVALLRKQLRALICMDPFEGWIVACTLKLEEDARRAAPMVGYRHSPQREGV
ncbi:uncharacterized protein TRAVEDRAFT_124113 [Trametes versicolor FP-101664 SS1]|uniref:uncharacterized protein n=1 Tax=Trametes versicolor (strain FP-101664) TaxID=717944 RepID=UPI0004622E78|nr:uncharacterized protein TRAVEDRAFT_124113 [Trametes versicolor FP-101664 SS1]EIW58200.1 hypothetical protein TRAVEDRAFT_124113 [Trametes versicolor FP-101664 SS1]